MKFSIKIKVRGKGRPRFGRGHAFTDPETRAYEDQLAWAAKAAGCRPSKLPIIMTLTAFFSPPASMSAKKRNELLGRPCMKKPDADNIAKCADAWNGIIFEDDAQIFDLRVQKYWGDDRLDVQYEEVTV